MAVIPLTLRTGGASMSTDYCLDPSRSLWSPSELGRPGGGAALAEYLLHAQSIAEAIWLLQNVTA